jgi:hypothetical protein
MAINGDDNEMNLNLTLIIIKLITIESVVV